MGMSISENWRDSLLSSDIAEICQGFVRPTGSGFPTLRCCQTIIAPLNHGQPSFPLQATGLLSPWTSCPGMSRILTWPPSHHQIKPLKPILGLDHCQNISQDTWSIDRVLPPPNASRQWEASKWLEIMNYSEVAHVQWVECLAPRLITEGSSSNRLVYQVQPKSGKPLATRYLQPHRFR